MKEAADKFFIRKALRRDINLIAALAATTFYETYFELDKPLDLADYIAENFNPDVIQAELLDEASIFFIAYLGKKAVGYAKLRKNSTAECIADENSIELQRIYLLQKMLGKGFGERLLSYCLEAASQQSYQSVWLSVWEHNLPAQGFYLKQGFVHAGKMPYPYGSEIATNFVMKKDL